MVTDERLNWTIPLLELWAINPVKVVDVNVPLPAPGTVWLIVSAKVLPRPIAAPVRVVETTNWPRLLNVVGFASTVVPGGRPL